MVESKSEKENRNGGKQRFDPELLKKGLKCDLDQYEMLKRCSDKKDMTEWNEWRKDNPDQKILLEGARLAFANLQEVNLRAAWMYEADLSKADLTRADLSESELSHSGLLEASLTGAKLVDSLLCGAYLELADLTKADLTRAFLSQAVLKDATLRQARLIKADLNGADVRRADLREADMRGACLLETSLIETQLSGARLSDALFGDTVIGTDFSEAIDLNHAQHLWPSVVGIDCILSHRGELPEKFLRGCGLRREEIAYFHNQIRNPIQFYTCFICYSTVDEKFASRLYDDFTRAGIACYKWDQNARTGRNLRDEIDRAIRANDKVVLIASESSLKSPAVIREIDRALVQEDERFKKKQAGEFEGDVDVLFPVRLDDYIFERWKDERKVDVTKKFIADARGWDSDPKIYAKVRHKLIADLRKH